MGLDLLVQQTRTAHLPLPQERRNRKPTERRPHRASHWSTGWRPANRRKKHVFDEHGGVANYEHSTAYDGTNAGTQWP